MNTIRVFFVKDHLDHLQSDIDTITLFLKNNFEAKVVILCGSRYVGDFTPQSDWDLIVLFTKSPVIQPELDPYNLDCMFYPFDVPLVPSLD